MLNQQMFAAEGRRGIVWQSVEIPAFKKLPVLVDGGVFPTSDKIDNCVYCDKVTLRQNFHFKEFSPLGKAVFMSIAD